MAPNHSMNPTVPRQTLRFEKMVGAAVCGTAGYLNPLGEKKDKNIASKIVTK